MTSFEWISLIAVLVGGFWTLTQKLTKIETALVGKVSYEDCSRKRDKCLCMQEIEKIKERISA